MFKCKDPHTPFLDRKGRTSDTAAAAPELRLIPNDTCEELRSTALGPDEAFAQFCEYLAHTPRMTKLILRTCVRVGAAQPRGVGEALVENSRVPLRKGVRRLLPVFGVVGSSKTRGLCRRAGRALRLRGLAMRYLRTPVERTRDTWRRTLMLSLTPWTNVAGLDMKLWEDRRVGTRGCLWGTLGSVSVVCKD